MLGHSGAADNRITYKAYGDSIAVFLTTGEGATAQNYYMDTYSHDYITLDGYSRASPSDSLYLKFVADTFDAYDEVKGYWVSQMFMIDGTIEDKSIGITIKGIEIDGEPAEYQRHMVWYKHAEQCTLQSNYIHHCHRPTGPIAPGDNTDLAQGTGDMITVRDRCYKILIDRNTCAYSNHATISTNRDVTDYASATWPQAIKITNNYVAPYWGGGIYLTSTTQHCLVDNNVIVRSGETTTKGKSGIYIAGSHNTVRRNAIYCPRNDGIGMKSSAFGGLYWACDSNMVYNNTIFNSPDSLKHIGYQTAMWYVNNDVWSGCAVEG